MTDHRYSPLELQMLLDVHTKGYVFPASAPGEAPAPPSSSHTHALDRLRKEGMIKPGAGFASFELTPKGTAWLEAVLSLPLPLPVETWSIPAPSSAPSSLTVELADGVLDDRIKAVVTRILSTSKRGGC